MGVFTVDNQPESSKRPKRGKAKKTLMLDAIRSVCGSEHKFMKKVINIGLGLEGEPANPTLLSLALNRVEPSLKSVSPMVNFEFRRDAKPHEQAADVMVAVSEGLIPPDIGQMFIASIKSMIDIEEYTELKDRIESIEGTLNGES